MLARNPVSTAALVFIPALAVLAILAPWIAPYDPNATDLDHVLQGPAPTHWFGTDQVGRDVFSRVLVAARLDLAIALSAVLLSFAIGTIIGGVAALYGGLPDRLTGRLTDVLMTFPLFVVAMAMVAGLGNSVQSIVLASAVVNLPFFVRLARTEISVLRSQQFVEAARAGGNSELKILFGFMIPNALPTLTVQVSTGLGWAVLERREPLLHRPRHPAADGRMGNHGGRGRGQHPLGLLVACDLSGRWRSRSPCSASICSATGFAT